MDQAPFSLPKLPYSLDDLEPVISKEILEIHYTKHHKGYVDHLNAAMAKFVEAQEKNDLASLLQLAPIIAFNGGGHWNHSLFWENLSPKAKDLPRDVLLDAIKSDFGSFDHFKEIFNTKTIAIQGSGWGWLAYNPDTKKMEVITTHNHGTLSQIGKIPLMVVDVWEHAYYLQYQNKRADFVHEIWKIINWSQVEKRYFTAHGI